MAIRFACKDGWVLPNGNVLLAIYPTSGFPKGGVAEVDRKTRKIVWSYQGQQKEISTVQPLGEDRYLVAELGPQPRAIVINRAGKILKSTPLACQKKNAHMQTRMLRVLPNGNYIAPHLLDFAVKEYDPDSGKVLRSFPTDDRGRAKRDWPFTAIRLANGNTLIGCTNGNRVIEVDAKGAIVWSVDNEDLGEKLLDERLRRAALAQRQHGDYQLPCQGAGGEISGGDARERSGVALSRSAGRISSFPNSHHQRQACEGQHLEVT